VLNIPTSIIITPHRISNAPGYDRIVELLKLEKSISFDLDHILLTIFLVLENQDPESFWAPYLKLLPEEIVVPTETDSYGQLWFDASNVVNNTLVRQRAVDYQFDKLTGFFAQHPQLLPKFRHFNKPLYEWAYNVVISRSFRLDFGVHKDTLCLVPFADLMNHNHVNVGWLFRGKHILTFYATNDLKPGDQIFNYYGDLGNEMLAQDFGFVSGDNPYTCATVMLPAPNPTDPLRDKRLGILKTVELDFNTPICVRQGPPTPLLLFASMVLLAGQDVLAINLTPDNAVDYLSDELLQRMSLLLVQSIDARLTEYKYSLQQDVRLLPLLRASANAQLTNSLAERRFNAVYLRYEEKSILESVKSFLNMTSGYHCSQLPYTFQGADDEVFRLRAMKLCVKYAVRVLVPLLQELSWTQHKQYLKPKTHMGPFEHWDFSQDPLVFPKDGMPPALCEESETHHC
jgi:hypothetical protein